MENRGLLFIPDISGFTRFVNESEIAHSRVIIQELLELLINANEIGLEISEIEGDAILFYKFGQPADLQTLFGQVEKMFCAFHRYLSVYDHRRICQCAACISAVNLTLKVITHYGEFTSYNVKNFQKLIGKDIIVAHQLLKNDIDQHEYWLVTRSLVPGETPAEFKQWMEWNASVKQTESGDVPFVYTQLGRLKSELPPEPLPEQELAGKVKVLSVSRLYDANIKDIFYTAGHFEFRSRWQEGVKVASELDHSLPRVGSHHRYIYNNGKEVEMYLSSFSFDPEKQITYSETEVDGGTTICYSAEKTGENRARFTIDYYMRKGAGAQLFFNLFEKKKRERALRRSLDNLEPLLKEIPVPDF